MSGVAITDDVVAQGRTGRVAAVATGTATQITAVKSPLSRGVQLKADSLNGGKVFFGFSAAITADAADATDGFQLSAGEGLFVSIDDLSKIWLLASAVSQKIWWAAW